MTFAITIHRLVIVLLLMGLSGCTDFFNSFSQGSPTEKPGNVYTKGRSAKHQKRGYRLGSYALLTRGPGLSLTQTRDPAATGNMWDRLTTGFKIPYSQDNPQIRSQVQWFLQHQGYLDRTTQHAEPYMYLVYDQVKQRNLPTELVLLPVIESAYYPFAYSGAGAAGLWQIMPGTARKFGLKRNFYYDGRRDIFASTHAALDYLAYLQDYFDGDWLLAIAAYDCGEGTVSEAIRRNIRLGKNTDFWSLRLPAETRTYVPRLLALTEIVKNRETYPVHLPIIDDQPYLGLVDAGTQIKLTDAARLAGMSLHELKHLNPGYSRHTTDPNGTHRLLIPLDKMEDFKQKLADFPHEIQITWGRYKVQQGDTLQKIASRFHTTTHEIKEANNGTSLKAGKIILIPRTSQLANASPRSSKLSASGSKVSQKKNKIVLTYTIQRGDTLGKIAKRHHLSVEQLQEWNQLTSTMKLKPGTRLQLAKTTGAQTTSLPEIKDSAQFHIVRSGDTFEAIAKKYGITTKQLQANNQTVNAKRLRPGQSLVIF